MYTYEKTKIRETRKKLNRKIDAIVEDVKDLHEAGHGDWNTDFGFDEINFDYGNIERQHNDI